MIQYPGREANHAAYQKLRASIDKQYPRGHLVAIHQGKIVADAADFDVLEETLDRLGLDPRQTLIVEAGVNEPEKVDIFV